MAAAIADPLHDSAQALAVDFVVKEESWQDLSEVFSSVCKMQRIKTISKLTRKHGEQRLDTKQSFSVEQRHSFAFTKSRN